MLIWIVLASITAAVALVLVSPLMRVRREEEPGHGGEAAVYRDQLAELERDRNLGLMRADEAEYAKAEIGRRLLAASAVKSGADQNGGNGRHPLATAFVICLLPVTGLCLYLAAGRPDLPAQPLQARLEKPGNDIELLVAQAERYLAQNPDDGAGWDLMAPIYTKGMRLAEAQTAYRKAILILGESPARLSGLGEVLVMATDGIVTDEALDAFRKTLALQPEDPRALFYVGLGMEQAGRTGEARSVFERLANVSPADAPWMGLVQQHIARTGGPPLASITAPQTPAGPSLADIAAAQDMAAGDRQRMIHGMVAGLDARLRENPNDFEGWLRLVRSYRLLEDDAKALQALESGLRAFPPEGEQGRQLLALARELRLATPEVTR